MPKNNSVPKHRGEGNSRKNTAHPRPFDLPGGATHHVRDFARVTHFNQAQKVLTQTHNGDGWELTADCSPASVQFAKQTNTTSATSLRSANPNQSHGKETHILLPRARFTCQTTKLHVSTLAPLRDPNTIAHENRVGTYALLLRNHPTCQPKITSCQYFGLLDKPRPHLSQAEQARIKCTGEAGGNSRRTASTHPLYMPGPTRNFIICFRGACPNQAHGKGNSRRTALPPHHTRPKCQQTHPCQNFGPYESA